MSSLQDLEDVVDDIAEELEEIQQKWKVIGKGAFGTVHKVRYNHHNYAVKKIQIDSASEEAVAREVDIGEHIFRLEHENLLSCLEIPNDDDSENIYLLMEFCKHGNLETYMNRVSVDREQVINFMIDIISGLHFLHEEEIIHRDLKPQNILVKDNLTCVIGDFGLSKFWDEDYGSTVSPYTAQYATFGGTPRYMAPELRKWYNATKKEKKKLPKYSLNADTYSCGIIFQEMLNGEEGDFFEEELSSDETDPVCGHIGSMIEDMISEDPDERPPTNAVRKTIKKYRACDCSASSF